MQWVASTLHTTSEHGVSSITTADAAHLGCQQSTELTPPTGRFKWTRSVSPKDEIWFLRVCHHISTGLYMRKDREDRQKGGSDDAERRFSSLMRTCLIGLTETDKQDVTMYHLEHETNLETDLNTSEGYDSEGTGKTCLE